MKCSEILVYTRVVDRKPPLLHFVTFVPALKNEFMICIGQYMK